MRCAEAMETLCLTSNRVLLDTFREMDITDAYIGWLNDPQVVRFSNQRFRRHDRASCLVYLASFEATANLFLAIRRTDNGGMVGTMTAYRNLFHGTTDVGIMVGDTAVWGQGYGQEAWNLLTGWLLKHQGVRKLTAGTLACNHGMVRIMERSGMHCEAVRKEQELVDGRPEDIVYYARFGRD